MRGRGILLEPGFQGFYALVELTQFSAHSAQIGLHGRWGLCPVLGGKGKRPDSIGGLRQRFHDVPASLQQGEIEDCFIAELCDWVQRKILGERDTERHDLRLPRVATL